MHTYTCVCECVPSLCPSVCLSLARSLAGSSFVVFWQVLDRLNELRCYPTLCDVTLIAGGSRLTAHRAILASASHYFLAMFTSGMKEGRAAEVEIGHVQFDVLKTIVDSIYSRTLEVCTGCTRISRQISKV